MKEEAKDEKEKAGDELAKFNMKESYWEQEEAGEISVTNNARIKAKKETELWWPAAGEKSRKTTL